jgi:hypothetical protein
VGQLLDTITHGDAPKKQTTEQVRNNYVPMKSVGADNDWMTY